MLKNNLGEIVIEQVPRGTNHINAETYFCIKIRKKADAFVIMILITERKEEAMLHNASSVNINDENLNFIMIYQINLRFCSKS